MSVRFDGTADQLLVNLASALTIGTGDYITSAWVRVVNDRDDNSLFWALVDAEPNATVSRRVWTDPSTTPDSVYVDASGGGIGGHSPTTGTWYFYVYERVGGVTRIRVFDDSSGTTPVTDQTQSADTTNLTTLDVIIVGDIEPSARVAADMEFTSLKVQTAVAGWTDSECRTESQFFAIQKAGGTDRYAWRLEDIDADTNGLNEIGGSGPNFSNSGAIAGSTRPSQLEAVGGPPTIEQEGYRWLNDDGSESAATFAAAQDAGFSVQVATAARLRALLNATNDPAAGAYQLEYRKQGESPWLVL